MAVLLPLLKRHRTGRRKRALCFCWLASTATTQALFLWRNHPYSAAGAGPLLLAASAAAWSSSSSSSISTTSNDAQTPISEPPRVIRYRARVAYDGRRYQGFQLQSAKSKRRTIQGELERVLHKRLLGGIDPTMEERIIKVVAAGRTDAGVHARGQAIHFDVPVLVQAGDDDDDDDNDATTASSSCITRLDNVCRVEFQLNQMLPSDIQIWNLEHAPKSVTKEVPIDKIRRQSTDADVDDDADRETEPSTLEGAETTTTTTTTTTVSYRWNVLYDSTRKLYCYRMALGPVMPPTERYHRWRYPFYNSPDRPNIDPSQLQRILKFYEGTHDFRAFAGSVEQLEKSLGGSPVNTVRTVYSVDLVQEDPEWGFYRIDICLKGALYKQVRNMVGTALDVAVGRMEQADFEALLANDGGSKRRQDNKCQPVPPEGLTLENVYFDNDPGF